MEQHDFLQGSPEWHAHRATHRNASDVPAMLGISPYKTRSQLLQEMATGIAPEVDEATQRRFADGHRFEALARPMAEKIIGKKLYPVVGSDGNLSASFDGITMDELICWEHKSLNDGIRRTMAGTGNAALLGEHYRAQMEQQLMVSGARKCLFMATIWNGGECLEETHGTYESDPDMRQRIIDGWAQFEKDLAAYVPAVIAERPPAEVTMELPALFIQAHGAIIDSNMQAYGEALAAKLAEVRSIALVTDQDFSNAKEAAKLFREQFQKLKLTKEAMLSQTTTIGEAARMIDAWGEDLRVTALQLEKDVEREDLAKKRSMVSAATLELTDHINALEKEIAPIRLIVDRPDFAAAIKGKRNYASMQDAVSTALSNDGKAVADAVAMDIRGKLSWFREYAKGYEALFADLQQIIYKQEADFDMLVETRIKAHKEAESEKLEAERQRIQKEEEAKAEAKVRAEQEAKAKAEKLEAERQATTQAAISEPVKLAEAPKQSTPVAQVTAHSAQHSRPTDSQIIGHLAAHYSESEQTVRGWIADIANQSKKAA